MRLRRLYSGCTATDEVSSTDEAQSFQNCLNLSGANAVYRTVDAMLRRPK